MSFTEPANRIILADLRQMFTPGTRTGSTINGKWRVGELLGRGGMAEVYAATHRNGKRAALKVMHRELVAQKATLRRFRREGYAANRVGHPAVVTVDDDDICEDGAPYLVMELLAGFTLEQLRSRQGGRLCTSRILRLGGELMAVIAVAHRRGIVHRDIKPSNLFLTNTGTLKVLDFGIARVGERQSSGENTMECFLGTPAYMSPEQARGRWELVGARSDIYSIGATLFTLFTGHPVHRAGTRNEQLGLAMTAQAPSLSGELPGVPERIARVVDRALRYDRDERWPTLEAMHQEWQRASLGVESEPTEDLAAPAEAAENSAPSSACVETLSQAHSRVGSAARPSHFRAAVWLAALAGGAAAVASVRASGMIGGPSIGSHAEPLRAGLLAREMRILPKPRAPSSAARAEAASREAPLSSAESRSAQPSAPPLASALRIRGPITKKVAHERLPVSSAGSLGPAQAIPGVLTVPVAASDSEEHALDRRR